MENEHLSVSIEKTPIFIFHRQTLIEHKSLKRLTFLACKTSFEKGFKNLQKYLGVPIEKIQEIPLWRQAIFWRFLSIIYCILNAVKHHPNSRFLWLLAHIASELSNYTKHGPIDAELREHIQLLWYYVKKGQPLNAVSD